MEPNCGNAQLKWNDTGGDASSPGTHALVIGVSRYRHLDDGDDPRGHQTFGLKQLDCAASGAFQVACWLRDHYCNPRAPLTSVRLLLSPSPYEQRVNPALAAATAAVPAATWSDVEKAATDWRVEWAYHPDNVGIFYAAGHGICAGEEIPVVLLEAFAAHQRSLRTTLDVVNLCQGMKTAGAPRQVFFIDACGVEPEKLKEYAEGGLGSGEFFSDLRQAPEWRRAAPLFLSALRGTSAHGIPGVGTIFSNALIQCFNGLASERLDAGYVVTVLGMAKALPPLVERVAHAHGLEQYAQPNVPLIQLELHQLDQPPRVPLSIHLDPADAAAVVHGAIDDRVGDSYRTDIFRAGSPFRDSVEAGLYTVRVDVVRELRDLRNRTELIDPQPPYPY